MKKLKVILSIILFLVLSPIVVQADMGVPGITNYNVRVKNISGANILSHNNESIGKLPYDSVITIMSEYNINGSLYGYIEYNDYKGYIKLSDTEILKDAVDTSGFEKKEKESLYVFKKGAYLYKGPSMIYEKVDNNLEIPVGTILDYEYSDEMFAYVTYKGISGWVYIYSYEDYSPYDFESSLAHVLNKKTSLYFKKDQKLETLPLSKSYFSNTLPKDTKISYKYYYYAHPHATYIYIEDNNYNGWVEYREEDVYHPANKDSQLLTLDKVNIYDIDLKNVLGTIPKDTEVSIIYYIEHYLDGPSVFYIEYNGIKGWVSDYYLDDNFVVSQNLNKKNYNKYITKTSFPIYSKINGPLTNKTIPEETEINVKYKYFEHSTGNPNWYDWYYVIDSEYEGWIFTDRYTYNNLESVNVASEPFEDEEEDFFDDYSDYPTEIPDESEKTDEVEEDIENNNFDDSKFPIPITQVVLYCIGGAIVISLTSFVTIRLINKKKANNE